MPMRIAISHTTRYDYDAPVPYALQHLRMTPKSRMGHQTIVSWEIIVEGGEVELSFDDQHNNRVSLVSTEAGQSQLLIHCKGEVETSDSAGMIGLHGGFAPLWYFRRTTPLTKAGPHVRKLIKSSVDDNPSDLETLHALSHRVLNEVRYETGTTLSDTSAEEALALGKGVCQDHAHIFISAARLLGFPARYVSGYLLMDGQKRQEASHGWAEIYVDNLGWVGFDVTNGICPDERYIRMATGLDYHEAAPVTGMRFGESGEAIQVELHIEQ